MADKKWDDRFYVKAFICARQGFTDKKIASTIGVSQPTFDKWKKARPALADALASAREDSGRSTVATFQKYVYKRLSPELQEYFDQLSDWEEEPNQIRRVEKLLVNKGRKIRQQLFLHAFVSRNFSVSEACRFVNIARSTFEMWVTTDPEFGDLLDEMMAAKQDLCESALLKLVDGGDVNATIFANKALNKDRGYGDKLSVEVSGQITHAHAVVKIDELDLDLDTRKTLLSALRQKKLVETTATTMGDDD